MFVVDIVAQLHSNTHIILIHYILCHHKRSCDGSDMRSAHTAQKGNSQVIKAVWIVCELIHSFAFKHTTECPRGAFAINVWHEFHYCRDMEFILAQLSILMIVTNIIHIGKISSWAAEYSHIRWEWERHFFFPKRQQQYCMSFEFMQSISHFPLTALSQSSHGKYH